MIAAGLLAVIIFIGALYHQARTRRAKAQEILSRLEEEQNRMLQGLILSQEAASRILTPGELTGTIERIAREAVDVLGVEGARVLVSSSGGKEEPMGITRGHIPDRVADASAAIGADGELPPVQEIAGLGSVLSIPIRMGDQLLGEFRLAEYAGRPLNIREIHIARLLAQLVGIAAQYRIQRTALEQAEEDKRRFILATTHDLRAPISTIQQLLHVLLDGYAGVLEGKQKEVLEKMHGRTEDMLDLLSDLLDLAAEDQGIGRMRELVEVCLGEIFDKQVEATRMACEVRGIEIRAHRPDIRLVRKAAHGDLEKILGNLLSNAVKYTNSGGRISVRLEESPGGILFRVKDTGIGIPKSAMPRLFTEYYRAPNAKEMERHGTGLGLALVQKLVRKYDGKIRVDSVEGRGTLVEVVLPPE
jgi:signal transduction histidine kinase